MLQRTFYHMLTCTPRSHSHIYIKHSRENLIGKTTVTSYAPDHSDTLCLLIYNQDPSNKHLGPSRLHKGEDLRPAPLCAGRELDWPAAGDRWLQAHHFLPAQVNTSSTICRVLWTNQPQKRLAHEASQGACCRCQFNAFPCPGTYHLKLSARHSISLCTTTWVCVRMQIHG